MLSKLTRQEVRHSPVNLSALAATVANELKQANPERNGEFVIQPDLIADADDNLMRIVFENLLGNAWKFTGREATARIEFGRTQQNDGPVYFVRDNGVGFDTNDAQMLFRAFKRLHHGTEFPGTGIGLATVQRCLNRHGGRIWAESAVEQGATFYFTLTGGSPLREE
jgi:light-regulated signal transduction histidine kinase (bacteriophytochrome)